MSVIVNNMGLLVEGVFILGGVLVFGFWQLWELKKLKKERLAKEEQDK